MARYSMTDEEIKEMEKKFYKETRTHYYERSVLFIGITGQGKSSLCNFLMKIDKFRTDSSLISCTDPSRQELANIKGRKYLLVDVPGVCDTFRNPKVILSELTKAFFFVRKQGISAIVIVINPHQKMIPELYDALGEFLKRISPNIWDHVFVVFTHEKEVSSKYRSGMEYINSILLDMHCPNFLKFISEQCRNRFLHVECRHLSSDEQYWETKIAEFTHYVDNIMTKNGFMQTEVMKQLDQNHQEFTELLSSYQNLLVIQEILLLKIEGNKTKIEKQLEVHGAKFVELKEIQVQIKEMDGNFDLKVRRFKEIFFTGLGYGALGLGAVILAPLGLAATLATGVVAGAATVAASVFAPVGLLVFGLILTKKSKADT